MEQNRQMRVCSNIGSLDKTPNQVPGFVIYELKEIEVKKKQKGQSICKRGFIVPYLSSL